MILLYEKHPPFARIHTENFALIRESFALIRESFAFIREKYHFFPYEAFVSLGTRIQIFLVKNQGKKNSPPPPQGKWNTKLTYMYIQIIKPFY